MKNTFAKTIALTAIAAGVAMSAHASEENAPNPSDLTQVNSFAFGTVDNDGTVKGMVGLAGAYSEGNNFIGLVEHGSATKNNDAGKKDQNTRLRYFQVLDTGLDAMPQAGFSVDYMKGWEKFTADGIGSDIVALGAIAKVKTPWESLSIFPNLAYVTGKAEGDLPTGEKGKADISGYQLNLFASLAVGEAGQYVVFQPQFMHVDVEPRLANSGKVDARVFKVKSGYGQPISADGKWWVEASHTYTRTDMKAKSSLVQGTDKDNDHKFELGVSYYF